MNETTHATFQEYLNATHDNAAAAALTLADVMQRTLDAGGTPQSGPEQVSLTVREAAQLLNVSAATVYSLCESGDLRHRRIGQGRGTIRIPREDLEAFRHSTTSRGAIPRTPRGYLVRANRD